MLRFFRTIRKKLIVEDNVRKYLLYATGEIFLVMIGILLALQVNNWNEDRKEQQERTTLINALKTDYQSTLLTVQGQVTKSESRSLLLEKLLAYSAGESIDISDDSLKIMLQESIRFEFIDNFSTTYEQAKSSGKLSLIQNENLLKALSVNEENFEGAASVEVPVFGESFSRFNIIIEVNDMIARHTNLESSPAQHPELTLYGPDLHSFLRNPDTYTKLHHIYFLNNLLHLWWSGTEGSVQTVLDEINNSLTQ